MVRCTTMILIFVVGLGVSYATPPPGKSAISKAESAAPLVLTCEVKQVQAMLELESLELTVVGAFPCSRLLASDNAKPSTVKGQVRARTKWRPRTLLIGKGYKRYTDFRLIAETNCPAALSHSC